MKKLFGIFRHSINQQGDESMNHTQPITQIVRKSTQVLFAAIVAIGLLASASHGLAITMTWTNGSALWTSTTAWTTNTTTSSDGITTNFCNPVVPTGFTVITNCAGGTGGFPAIGDEASFTNNTSYTVTIPGATTVGIMTFTNTAGTVTLDAGGSSLTVTGRMRIAESGASSRVVWAGGTLNVDASSGAAVLQLAPNADSFGALVVTNGTVKSAGSLNLGGASLTGTGQLAIVGPAVFTNATSPTLARAFRLRSPGCQLIVTNGGKFFWPAETRAISNSLILVSDPGSLMLCTNVAFTTACLSIGYNDEGAPGSLLIVRNSATVYSDGTFTVGRGGASPGQFCTFNTGIVTRAGRLITRFDGRVIIGTGSVGGSASNNLTVYDGGYFECGGPTVTIGNSAGLVGNSFNMGGVGAMSTGLAVQVNNNSTAVGSRFVVSNAVFTCTRVNMQGTSGNSVTVLSNGTLNLTGPIKFDTTNNLTINTDNAGTITIDAGTINANMGSNEISVVINGGGTSGGSLLNIINGGKLLSEVGTIGQNSGYNTGIVAGVGSVWSNWSGAVNITNGLTIGGTGSLNTGFNHLVVRNGASLYNNGTLNIGSTNTGPFNSVVFGGGGAASFIRNLGSLNIGGGGFTHGNTLLVTNATLDCDILNVGKSETTNNTLTLKGGTILAGLIRVRSTNTFLFTAGTLSAASMDTDPGANNNDFFVVGDGTSAAFYDMAAGGDGFHRFGSPGLVVTNGASLRGSGTLTGTIRVEGTFVPGFAGSVGSILTSNSLSFGSSAVLNYDLGSGGNDSVTVKGSLGLGNSMLNVTASGVFGAGTYVLITHTNTATPPSGTLNVNSLPVGFTGTISNDLPNSQVLLLVTPSGGGDPYDTWATSYGLSGGNALGGADPDGDGMSNTNEFLAGFRPNNNAAYLHIIDIAKSSTTNVTITYLGASGDSTWSPGIASRTNVLEFTTGAANGSYTNNFVTTGLTNILSGGTGLGTVTSFVHTNGASGATKYYRVRVLVP